MLLKLLLAVKLFLLGATVYPLVSSQFEGYQCPDGWTYFRDSCYLFADNLKVDWTEAGHHCGLHQAHLVKIDNKDEDLFLKDMARRLFRGICTKWGLAESFYTGGTDATIEGVWSWYSDHSPMTYTNWDAGQPEDHDSRDQDCLILTSTINFTWHDYECTHHCHPLCELELTDGDHNYSLSGVHAQAYQDDPYPLRVKYPKTHCTENALSVYRVMYNGSDAQEFDHDGDRPSD